MFSFKGLSGKRKKINNKAKKTIAFTNHSFNCILINIYGMFTTSGAVRGFQFKTAD